MRASNLPNNKKRRRSQTPELEPSETSPAGGEEERGIEPICLDAQSESTEEVDRDFWTHTDADYLEGLMTYNLRTVASQLRHDMQYKEGIWLINRAHSRQPLATRSTPVTFPECSAVLDQIQNIIDNNRVPLSLLADLAFCLPFEEFLNYTIPNSRLRQIVLPARLLPRRNRAMSTSFGFCPCCGLLKYLGTSEAAKHSPHYCFKTFSAVLLLVDLRDEEYPSVRSSKMTKAIILETLKFLHATCFIACYISTDFYKCTVCERIGKLNKFQPKAQACSTHCAGRRRKGKPFPNLRSLPSPTLTIMPEKQLEKLAPAHQDLLRTFWKNPTLAHTEVERLINEFKRDNEKSWLYAHFSQEVLHTASGPARALSIKYVGISRYLKRPQEHFTHCRLDKSPHKRYIADEFGRNRVIFWSRVQLPRSAVVLGESALTDLLRPILNNIVSPSGLEVKRIYNSYLNTPLAPHWLQSDSVERQHFAVGLLIVLTDLIQPGVCPESLEVEGKEEIKLAGMEVEVRDRTNRRL